MGKVININNNFLAEKFTEEPSDSLQMKREG